MDDGSGRTKNSDMLECEVLVVLLGVSADEKGKDMCTAGCIVLPDSNDGALVSLVLVDVSGHGSLQTCTGSWLVPETVVVVISCSRNT